MPSPAYDPLLGEIKHLHLLAFTLKAEFDKEQELATLLAAWQPFRLKQEEVTKKLPWAVKDKTRQFQRHCQWLEKRLQQGRPDDCLNDLMALCYQDIPQLEQTYLVHLLRSGPAAAHTYSWGELHPLVREPAQSRFEAGHYADAVEAAFKAINHLVKQAYRAVGGEDKERDGDDLMRKAFSYQRNPATHVVERPPRLLLTNRDLTTDSGYSVQEGYATLFAGAMRGIRNPKAHDNVVIEATEAWELLVFGSHLLRMWDRGQLAARTDI